MDRVQRPGHVLADGAQAFLEVFVRFLAAGFLVADEADRAVFENFGEL
ncbi:hypothetical protein ACFXAZ_19840 [Streptomyces sp. NPDC059477]